MQYQFIQNHQSEFRTDEMCECLDLGRSGYYSWGRREPSSRAIEDEVYRERIGNATSSGQGSLRPSSDPLPFKR